jgi:hypothetical protein
MSDFFQILGVGVGAYVAYGLVTGEVYAKSGAFGRTYERGAHPWGYWGAIGSYTLLAAALLLVF